MQELIDSYASANDLMEVIPEGKASYRYNISTDVSIQHNASSPHAV
jgi:hypothetical protein